MKRLNVEKRDGVIYLSGEVDVGNCAEFKEKISEQTGEAEGEVVLDFSSLDYIDSAGLGILVGVYKRLAEQGATLKVVNTNSYIKKLFRITKLETLFTVE